MKSFPTKPRDAQPVSVQCWANVADGGPTLNRHRVTVWSLASIGSEEMDNMSLMILIAPILTILNMWNGINWQKKILYIEYGRPIHGIRRLMAKHFRQCRTESVDSICFSTHNTYRPTINLLLLYILREEFNTLRALTLWANSGIRAQTTCTLYVYTDV